MCIGSSVEVQLNGETQYLLTTTLGDAKRRFGDHIVRVVDPVDLIHREFSDLAQLKATDLHS